MHFHLREKGKGPGKNPDPSESTNTIHCVPIVRKFREVWIIPSDTWRSESLKTRSWINIFLTWRFLLSRAARPAVASDHYLLMRIMFCASSATDLFRILRRLYSYVEIFVYLSYSNSHWNVRASWSRSRQKFQKRSIFQSKSVIQYVGVLQEWWFADLQIIHS